MQEQVKQLDEQYTQLQQRNQVFEKFLDRLKVLLDDLLTVPQQ